MSAEGKLREAEKQEEKQKQSSTKKLERLIEKVINLWCSVICAHVSCDCLIFFFPLMVSVWCRDKAK